MSVTEHFPGSLVDFETMPCEPESEQKPIRGRGIRVGKVRDLKYGAREYDVTFSSSPRLSAEGCTFVHMASPRSSRVSRTAFIDTELNDDFAKVVEDVKFGRRDTATIRLSSYVNDTIAPLKYGITVEGRVRKNTAGETELHLTRNATVTVPKSDTLTMIVGKHMLDFEEMTR
jgi:hypothetical protein